MAPLGDKLCRARLEVGISQGELGASIAHNTRGKNGVVRLRIYQQHEVSKWESGEECPTARALVGLERRLGFDRDELQQLAKLLKERKEKLEHVGKIVRAQQDGLLVQLQGVARGDSLDADEVLADVLDYHPEEARAKALLRIERLAAEGRHAREIISEVTARFLEESADPWLWLRFSLIAAGGGSDVPATLVALDRFFDQVAADFKRAFLLVTDRDERMFTADFQDDVEALARGVASLGEGLAMQYAVADEKRRGALQRAFAAIVQAMYDQMTEPRRPEHRSA